MQRKNRLPLHLRAPHRLPLRTSSWTSTFFTMQKTALSRARIACPVLACGRWLYASPTQRSVVWTPLLLRRLTSAASSRLAGVSSFLRPRILNQRQLPSRICGVAAALSVSTQVCLVSGLSGYSATNARLPLRRRHQGRRRRSRDQAASQRARRRPLRPAEGATPTICRGRRLDFGFVRPVVPGWPDASEPHHVFHSPCARR